MEGVMFFDARQLSFSEVRRVRKALALEAMDVCAASSEYLMILRKQDMLTFLAEVMVDAGDAHKKQLIALRQQSLRVHSEDDLCEGLVRCDTQIERVILLALVKAASVLTKGPSKNWAAVVDCFDDAGVRTYLAEGRPFVDVLQDFFIAKNHALTSHLSVLHREQMILERFDTIKREKKINFIKQLMRLLALKPDQQMSEINAVRAVDEFFDNMELDDLLAIIDGRTKAAIEEAGFRQDQFVERWAVLNGGHADVAIRQEAALTS
jgi:hypothetical protein